MILDAISHEAEAGVAPHLQGNTIIEANALKRFSLRENNLPIWVHGWPILHFPS
jgi:hypothetical protein